MTGFKNMLQDIADEAKPYDVFDRALVAGARRRRLRRVGAPTGAALVAGVILFGIVIRPGGPGQAVQPADTSPSAVVSPSPSVLAAPPLPAQCVAQRLPLPAGDPIKSTARSVDPTGRYIGGRSYLSGGRSRAILWVDGVPTTVPIAGDADKDIYHITSSGTVLGSGFLGDVEVWTVYQNGQASRLKGANAQPVDMNDLGVIVGTLDDRPAIWRTPTGEPEPLTLPPGLPADWKPTAIDDDGTLLGGPPSTAAVSHPPAYVWMTDGSTRQLAAAPMPDGTSGDAVWADEIRNGWVIGRVLHYLENPGRSGGFSFAGIRWNLRTGETTVTQPWATDVNAVGWQAGKDRGQGVLFSGSTVTVLPHVDGVAQTEIKPGVLGPEAPQIMGLSDDGRTIVGLQAITDSSYSLAPVVAVVWRCS